ncbi:MAG: Rieske 2Fe-2S domain-containing protein [Ktedonobacteraceae bacterium]|nr:Rieske 2Fe-2S domain-containing protein [Ktedonobacteraceae bacterium]
MPLDDLWIGEMLGVEAGGVKVLLINVEGAVQAYLDRCPHRASPLSELSSIAAVGPQTSAYTIAPVSLQVCRRCPLDTSQMKISPPPPLPLPPLANRVASGLQATLITTPWCP